MSNLVLYAVLGPGAGTAFSLLGIGIVAIFKGSGVVNFGQGGVALVGGIALWKFESLGIPTVVSALLALVVSALSGVLIYVLVMQPLRRAPMLAKNVAT